MKLRRLVTNFHIHVLVSPLWGDQAGNDEGLHGPVLQNMKSEGML